ncbi:MAG: RDD family protein [candidate division Zixibacteria bacterium]|nr:RDD family protein [candidate division Zixibacteria bacterium]MDH3937192.1 RDD family protein [candidate division Zixibacteria bacterium]MDH4032455.1 RDD family protein [candidate division Zixibacteria bacterium]
MSLSFNCPHCNASLVAQYLRPGDVCKCHQCGQECSVPVDATSVWQPSSADGQPTMAAPPPPRQVAGQLADRGTRLGAQLIDGLLVLPLIIVWVIIAGTSESDAGELMGFLLFILGMVGLIAYQWWLLSTEGQSIGKRMLNIKVVKLDGTNGGFETNVLMRLIINGFICIIPLYCLVDVLFIFSEERRCIHDHIAGTKVIMV